jgi:phosphoadenosine phosphosulfate reductase
VVVSLEALQDTYRGLTTEALIHRALTTDFSGHIAMVSSFGTESAILLHLMAQVDPTIPVLFLDTEKVFPETLSYVDTLISHLGLTNVHRLKPDPVVYEEDHDGTLWQRNYDRCCELRKVLPLQRALTPYQAWITGRKQYHGGSRAALEPIEHDGTHYKINPLYNWPFGRLRYYMETHTLPDHPLLAMGYLSVGCTTCTQPAADADNPRAGRWGDSDKDECGIHF